ncbi:hypothetical protein K439DRAFT_1335342 [Ramaria rubella]|nr:hypothetical protein K439DRAFT_1335342 [Ramaria rubella]
MTMNSPGTTPTDIQSHLYRSFLNGHTADVSLHTRGAGWEVIYQLHRVVLIQAGFFRSLFTAGFLESHRRNVDGSYLGSEPDEVTIRFDDLNITRSGPICIARLYGGGSELYLSPALVPTPGCPLTPSFYSTDPIPPCPPDHHPATPRFLLSLLATSIYLSIPSITSQALSMILRSVGPHTICRYLNFATGNGIGPPDSDDMEAAVGLEKLGKLAIFKDDTSSMTEHGKHEESDEFDTTRKFSGLSFDDSSYREDHSSISSTYPEGQAFNYGGIGDKVGEACACWLMRWSADILQHEEAATSQSPVASQPPNRPEHGPSRRRATMPSTFRPSSHVTVNAPTLWARGGLAASWVCVVISANDFFIKDEWERYTFATRVVDLRRRDGVVPDEELEWERLFNHGIHYSNMYIERLISISQHISPITGRRYVPIETIQAAHWTQTLLRHRIVSQSSVTRERTSSPPHDKELGITINTSEILAILSAEGTSDAERSKPYHPIPVDSSQRIGDADGAFLTASASFSQLLGNSPDASGQGHLPPRQSNFFGILTPYHTAASCIQSDATGNTRWSPYPPFRFAVEFWGVGQLLEKSRLHSHTIWYAGSMFNVYVQVARKKGIQLGVYLHRQSSVDPIPRASSPPISVSTRGERLLNSSNDSSNIWEPIPRPQSSPREHISIASSVSLPGAAFTVPGSPRPVTSPSVSQLPRSTNSPPSNTMLVTTAPLQPYRDPRSSIAAHFIISCASATGISLTRFSSSPDQFSVSQSWGWKSSSLRTEEYTEQDGQAKARDLNKETSLRATVVLGLI